MIFISTPERGLVQLGIVCIQNGASPGYLFCAMRKGLTGSRMKKTAIYAVGLLRSYEGVCADTLPAKLTLFSVMLQALKSLRTEPVAKTFIGEIPDVLIFAEMV